MNCIWVFINCGKFPSPPLIFPMVLKRKRRWQGRSPNTKAVTGPGPSQAFQHLEHMLDGNRLMTDLGSLQWDTIETSPSTQSRILEDFGSNQNAMCNQPGWNHMYLNVFNIFNLDSSGFTSKGNSTLVLLPFPSFLGCASRRAPRCESQISSKPSIKHWRIASGANPRSLRLLLSTGDSFVQLRKLPCYWKQHHGTRVSIDLCKNMWRTRKMKANVFNSDLLEPEKHVNHMKRTLKAVMNWTIHAEIANTWYPSKAPASLLLPQLIDLGAERDIDSENP